MYDRGLQNALSWSLNLHCKQKTCKLKVKPEQKFMMKKLMFLSNNVLCGILHIYDKVLQQIVVLGLVRLCCPY